MITRCGQRSPGRVGYPDGVERLSSSRSGAVGTLINRPMRNTGVGQFMLATMTKGVARRVARNVARGPTTAPRP
jgi:hypothetical protein